MYGEAFLRVPSHAIYIFSDGGNSVLYLRLTEEHGSYMLWNLFRSILKNSLKVLKDLRLFHRHMMFTEEGAGKSLLRYDERSRNGHIGRHGAKGRKTSH